MVLNAITNDRALVYVDDKLNGILSSSKNINTVSVTSLYFERLKILVENQELLNYSNNTHDFKGIFNVTINKIHLKLLNITGFRLSNLTDLSSFKNTTGWGKDVAHVNGNNLGRYWPLVGPQITLYVPAQFLYLDQKILEIIELEYLPSMNKMKFQNEPNLGTKFSHDGNH
ncbi:hypothetical protein M0802_015086 [Mischocyttarus mexicanus]|nr:hypothetical protein M0802_015086 [Mischocyttarus mexicanus]